MTLLIHKIVAEEGHQKRLPGQRPVPDADRIDELLAEGWKPHWITAKFGYNARWVMSARLLQP